MKQPFAIAMRTGNPFGLGGIWENWKDPTSGEWLRTFAIITIDANALRQNSQPGAVLVSARRQDGDRQSLRQRLLNDVVRFAMQWALNPHIRTFSCSASLLFAASRSLFAASRPTVCGCADRQVETA